MSSSCRVLFASIGGFKQEIRGYGRNRQFSQQFYTHFFCDHDTHSDKQTIFAGIHADSVKFF